MRDSLSKIAGWRLKRNEFRFPIEQKIFDLYVKATGQSQPRSSIEYVPAVDA
jgi:hypothetical protein